MAIDYVTGLLCGVFHNSGKTETVLWSPEQVGRTVVCITLLMVLVATRALTL